MWALLSLKLQRLAGAEEILPFPDVNPSDSLIVGEVDCSIKQCLHEVELRDYNPVQHSGGFHQKLNELVAKGLQSGLVTSEFTNTASDSTCHDSISSQTSLARDNAAPQEEKHPSHQGDEHDKGIVRLTKEWEQLIVGDIPRTTSLPSEPDLEKPRMSPTPASQRPLDTRTWKILERLGNPKQMKAKVTSPTEVSGIVVTSAGGITDSHQATSSQLMKPTFHRLKRKHS